MVHFVASCNFLRKIELKNISQLFTHLRHKYKVYSLYINRNLSQGVYLWFGPQVNDAIQLDVLAEMFMQPTVPVLINGPLRLI